MICPICENEFEGKFGDRFFPFCSGRCKNIDLYMWFSDCYVVKSKEFCGDDDEVYDIDDQID